MIILENEKPLLTALSGSLPGPLLAFVFLSMKNCAPCSQLDNVIREYEKGADPLPVYKANIDVVPTISAMVKVKSVPTLALMRGNEVLSIRSGAAVPRSAFHLRSWLSNFVQP